MSAALGGPGRGRAGSGATARIRRARPADGAAIAEVHRRSIRELCAGDYSPRQIADWTRGIRPQIYRRAMAELGEEMLVADAGGRVVGYAALLDDEVRAVYVHPRWAGRGVGSRLLGALERRAARRGVRALRCIASLTALPFYRARGFRSLGPTTYASPRGFTLPAVLLRKRLP